MYAPEGGLWREDQWWVGSLPEPEQSYRRDSGEAEKSRTGASQSVFQQSRWLLKSGHCWALDPPPQFLLLLRCRCASASLPPCLEREREMVFLVRGVRLSVWVIGWVWIMYMFCLFACQVLFGERWWVVTRFVFVIGSICQDFFDRKFRRLWTIHIASVFCK